MRYCRQQIDVETKNETEVKQQISSAEQVGQQATVAGAVMRRFRTNQNLLFL